MSEFFPHGDIESLAVPGEGYIDPKAIEGKNELKPQNDLTARQKLEICTQMAEALADLHGHVNGVMVHQGKEEEQWRYLFFHFRINAAMTCSTDIQLSQFLYNADKSIVKLNDFNRAEMMLWDDEAKEYCRYHEGPGNGNVRCRIRWDPPFQKIFLTLVDFLHQWRSPEEYYDKPVNEQIDIFALGNNFYSILTGLWPFYDTDSDKEVKVRACQFRVIIILNKFLMPSLQILKRNE